MTWPREDLALDSLQRDVAGLHPSPWRPTGDPASGGCFVCFARGGQGRGRAGDPGWAAAVVMADRHSDQVVIRGRAGAAYRPGLLAAREGELLATAVQGLSLRPDVLLVNACGLDHPRRCGLAVHLGWALGIPTIGVTHRPFAANGEQPGPDVGSRSPLWIGSDQVGWWLRTRSGARPLAVSGGWGTDLETVCDVVMESRSVRSRTPAPLRNARQLARSARSGRPAPSGRVTRRTTR